MILLCILSFLVSVSGNNVALLQNQQQFDKLERCLCIIIEQYFSEAKQLTYVADYDDGDLLKKLHIMSNIPLITKQSNYSLSVSNEGYLIISRCIYAFTKKLADLTTEMNWNPHARFLVAIKELEHVRLREVFDALLKKHVFNVLVLNGNYETRMYTYNPFEKYSCGRYYERIIDYGDCSNTISRNLFPEKLVTGLRSCTFRAMCGHQPPYSKDPRLEPHKPPLSAEEMILKLLGEKEGFTLNISYTLKKTYSAVSPNITIIGAMDVIQKNETEIIFGALWLTDAKATAMTYLTGFHDYVEDLSFVVKAAGLVPYWKYVYLEFELGVWLLLLLSFSMYGLLTLMLLRAEDKSAVFLDLFKSLLLNGFKIRCRFSVMCVLIIWVWFSYLINTFYQTSLISITTRPISEYQIKNVEDLRKYELKPCFPKVLVKLFETEINPNMKFKIVKVENCEVNTLMDQLSTSDDIYTVLPNYLYLIQKQKVSDKWGRRLVYSFKQPYSKGIFCFYFYKGFPLPRSLRLNALRLRDSGLVSKILNDQWYANDIKYYYAKKQYEGRFFVPWIVYVIGISLASLTFVLELLVRFK